MYIDPSSGGQLVQILLVAFAAISGSVLVFAGRIRMYFAKLRRNLRNDGGEEIEQENASEIKE